MKASWERNLPNLTDYLETILPLLRNSSKHNGMWVWTLCFTLSKRYNYAYGLYNYVYKLVVYNLSYNALTKTTPVGNSSIVQLLQCHWREGWFRSAFICLRTTYRVQIQRKQNTQSTYRSFLRERFSKIWRTVPEKVWSVLRFTLRNRYNFCISQSLECFLCIDFHK